MANTLDGGSWSPLGEKDTGIFALKSEYLGKHITGQPKKKKKKNTHIKTFNHTQSASKKIHYIKNAW